MHIRTLLPAVSANDFSIARHVVPALCLWLALALAAPETAAAARVTLLIPSKPSVEEQFAPLQGTRAAGEQLRRSQEKKDSARKVDKKEARDNTRNGKKKNAEETPDTDSPGLAEITAQVNASILASVAPHVIKEEVDLLIAGMEPFRLHGYGMDPPRLLSIYRFDKYRENPDTPAGREDRLGDIEEIRYLDQKAWGANVGLSRPGLYQFAIETQPWWHQARAGYTQHFVKVMLPVYGEDWGWHLPLNLQFEIVPDVRPFGLLAPALFSARVIAQGKETARLPVSVCRVNTEKSEVPTPWSETIELLCDDRGRFSVVLNKPGWWCFMASRQGAPLKGPDGQPSPLEVSALFWLYVDQPR